MQSSDPPTRAVLVKTYRSERSGARALLALCTGALGFQLTANIWLWMQFGVSFPPPLAAVVMVVGPAIFLMFVWALAWGEAGKCDLEMAERSLRLPFQRHRNRHGWRRFEEIRFFAIRPDPLSVGEGRAMARRLRARGPRRWVYRLRVAEWRRWGGLLAITEDEVIWLRESFEVLRFLDEHWSAGRTDGGRVSPSLTAATAI